MYKILEKITTTSLIAVLLLNFAFLLIGYIVVVYGSDATTRTQVITGLFGVLAWLGGYYYSASKKSSETNAPIVNANTIDTLNNGETK